jgi:phosphoribosylaminoimidazolecarboxamide formyltransferase/IMP cyclohydrolase
MNLRTIHRALVSVSDKTGIVDFVTKLQRWNVEIISTGGTLNALRAAGVNAASISDLTGFPEILDGRVKTLHPGVHGALLAVEDNPSHMEQLSEHHISPIDLVVVNLYPFEQTVSRGAVALDDAIEQIDIGGPAMLRSAAKNFKFKTVVVNPRHYGTLIEEMERNNGAVSEETRFMLAKEVFLHTSHYDTVIARYLTLTNGASSPLPDYFSLSLPKRDDLRYGENPHQRGALYGRFYDVFEKLHGKELSYNNIVDLQAAAALIAEFSEPAVVILKHTNPCGVGTGATLAEAYAKAFATDTKSAFGGIVAVNRALGADAVRQIDGVFTELVVAPEYEPGALELLKKKKDRRLIRQRAPLPSFSRLAVKDVAGGLLVQTPDDVTLNPDLLKVVTRRQPSPGERESMMFAWKVAKHVKSNAVVYAREDRTVGIGAGQMSRFDASRLAALKAADMGLDLKGTAVASDAFFPFADGMLEAAKAGATAVIQPGGSVRDQEVIAAADEHDIAMIFTGIRHFKH